MDKIIKSLFISIISSGIIYLILYYFNLVFINHFLLIGLLVIILFLIPYVYFRLNSPKYSKEEVIEKYNLPVKEEESLMVVDREIVEEEISKPVISQEQINQKLKEIEKNKKPKEIPKQNLNHRNYADVFKNINQTIQEKKEIKSLEESDDSNKEKSLEIDENKREE
jgi:ABC-type multidrug transport system fused ATPase/permease subunit